MKLMEYQTKRGGRTVFQDISKPTTMEWGTLLQANYLDEQVEGIKEISDMVTKLKRAGDGLGTHIIDKWPKSGHAALAYTLHIPYLQYSPAPSVQNLTSVCV